MEGVDRVSICKKADETDCSNCRSISLLSTTHKMLSNTLRSKFIPYAGEITVERQCGFRYNRSTTDHLFCIREYLRKNGTTVKQCISYL